MINSFLNKVFIVCRVAAAIVVLICILVMAWGAVKFVFSGAKKVQIPGFETVVEAEKASSATTQGNSKEDYREISERRKIEKKFGDDIEDIVSNYGMDKKYYDFLTHWLLEQDDEYRGRFIKGIKSFMKDAKKYNEKHSPDEAYNYGVLSISYRSKFEEAVIASERSKVISKENRQKAIHLIGGALCSMILFLIIPILLQIEINTRKTPAVNGHDECQPTDEKTASPPSESTIA